MTRSESPEYLAMDYCSTTNQLDINDHRTLIGLGSLPSVKGELSQTWTLLIKSGFELLFRLVPDSNRPYESTRGQNHLFLNLLKCLKTPRRINGRWLWFQEEF